MHPTCYVTNRALQIPYIICRDYITRINPRQSRRDAEYFTVLPAPSLYIHMYIRASRQNPRGTSQTFIMRILWQRVFSQCGFYRISNYLFPSASLAVARCDAFALIIFALSGKWSLHRASHRQRQITKYRYGRKKFIAPDSLGKYTRRAMSKHEKEYFFGDQRCAHNISTNRISLVYMKRHFKHAFTQARGPFKKYDDTRFVDAWAKCCFERICDAAETAADLFP